MNHLSLETASLLWNYCSKPHRSGSKTCFRIFQFHKLGLMLFRSTNGFHEITNFDLVLKKYSNQNELKISFLRFWKKLKYKNEIVSNYSKCFGVCYHMIFIRSCIFRQAFVVHQTNTYCRLADLQNTMKKQRNISLPSFKTQHKIATPLILMARPLLALLQSGFPSIKGNLSFWVVKFYTERTCLYMSMSLIKRYNYVDRIYLIPTQLLEIWTHLYVSEIKSEGNCNSSGYYTKVNLNMYKELDSLLNIQGLYLKKQFSTEEFHSTMPISITLTNTIKFRSIKQTFLTSYQHRNISHPYYLLKFYRFFVVTLYYTAVTIVDWEIWCNIFSVTCMICLGNLSFGMSQLKC